MLRRGNVADNGPFVKHFGFTPVAFPAGIARKPLTEADRWHARLALNFPPARPLPPSHFSWMKTTLPTATMAIGRARYISRPLALIATTFMRRWSWSAVLIRLVAPRAICESVCWHS